MPQKKAEDRSSKPEKLNHNQIDALWYFERMDQVNRAMQGTNDLEQMMKDLLDTLLDVFNCDRAFLVYPCNPDHPTWQVPMERTRPEYPGVLPIGVDLPLDPVGAEVYRILRNTNGPVKFGIGEKHAVPIEMETAFKVRSFIAMAFYPKVGDPWSFGLHQCSHPRVWSSDEERLFQEIGRRLSDTLSTLLSYRSLKESEAHIKHLIDASSVAMVVSAGEEEKVISINGKFIELFGYTIEDMPDIAHWWPLAYPDAQYRDVVKAQWAEKVQKAMQAQSQIEPMETQVTCKDGSIRYVEFQFSSIGEQHLVTFVDLTAHKQAELALKEREQAYRLLVENIPDLIVRYDTKICRVYVNPAWERSSGVSATEAINKHPLETPKISGSANKDYIEKLEQVLKTGIPQSIEFKWVNAFGKELLLEYFIVPEYDQHGNISGVLSVGRDITERKRMEDALAAHEREFRTLAENSPDNIARYDIHGQTLYVNPRLEKTLKHTASEMLDTFPATAGFIKEASEYQKKIIEVIKTGKEQEIDLVLPDSEKGSRYHNVRFVAERGDDGTITGVLAIGRDITERKLVEDALRQSREATLLFSKQLTTLQEVINQLSEAETADDLNRMAVEIGRNLLEVDRMGIWFVDGQRKLMHGSFGIDEQGNLRDERNSTIELKEEGLAWLLLSTKKPMAQIENHALQDDKNRKVGEGYSAQAALWDGNNVLGIVSVDNLLSGMPISEQQLDILQLYANSLGYLIKRKWAEERLHSSEKKYRALAENIPNVVFQCKNDERYTFVYLNKSVLELTGYSKEDFLEKGLSFFDLYHPEDRVNIPKPSTTNQSLINHRPYHLSYRIKHRSGEWRWVDEWGTGVINEKDEVEYIQGIMIDITSRKQYERERETIITVSAALRQATNRNEVLGTILDQMIELLDAGGAFIATPDGYDDSVLIEMGRGVIGNSYSGMKIPHGRGASGWVIANRLPYLNNQAQSDPIFYRPDMLGEYHCVAAVPLIAHDQSIGTLWLARKTEITEQDLKLLSAIADIAANAIHRITLHEQTEKQLNHLIALHQIDLAITTNFGLEDTLNIILGHVCTELNVDAASILLMNEAENALEYAAGLGFKTEHIKLTHVKIGDGTAGRAALEKHTASAADLELASQNDSRSTLIAHEKFTSHVATPLLIKGQVKGILEIFHQTPQNPDSKWLDYFETLATQTMIAIENASLLKTLHVKNEELTLAYDATIEGWSRALDLRDHETEGHTQRVTEMALKLADLLGMSQTDKTDMRRGALLHDIGKMGVPDAILHKPGGLTETEWKVMREHPTLAYRMLSPISYLNRALDISYYHHERWDGSGYPHGLRGEEIPLAARVFAIVDVFDALTSDRPYRKAWSYEKAYQYIELQAGKHFDPEIVKVFLTNK